MNVCSDYIDSQTFILYTVVHTFLKVTRKTRNAYSGDCGLDTAGRNLAMLAKKTSG